MADWSNIYDGFGRNYRLDSKGNVKPPSKQVARAELMFWEQVDVKYLEAFLQPTDTKHRKFLAAIRDPSNRNIPYALLARRAGLTLHELNMLYVDGMREVGLISMANNLPQVMVDVSEDAKSTMRMCPRCDGVGTVYDIVRSDDGEVESRTSRACPNCEGVGKLRAPGDKDSRSLMFESMKLTNQRAPLVAIQNNISDDARMETILKMTQSAIMGEDKMIGEADNVITPETND